MANNNLLCFFKNECADKSELSCYGYMCVCRRGSDKMGGWRVAPPPWPCSRPPRPRRKVAHALFLVPHKLADKAAVIAALQDASCKTDGSTAKLALSFFDLGPAAQAAFDHTVYDDSWTKPAFMPRS